MDLRHSGEKTKTGGGGAALCDRLEVGVHGPVREETPTHRASARLLRDKTQTSKDGKHKALTSPGPSLSALPRCELYTITVLNDLRFPPNTSSCFRLCTFCCLDLEWLSSAPSFLLSEDF